MTKDEKEMKEATDAAYAEELETGTESPMSVTSVIYYRGVSISVTKRTPNAKVLPLLESQMKMIDWALDEKKCLPSWNLETAKEIAEHENTKWLGDTEGIKCNMCGAKAVMKTGTSKKGKAWKGLFCSTGDKNHTQWLD